MNKLKVLCIHHTDLDGAGSAACVGLKHINDEVTYRIYNYAYLPLLIFFVVQENQVPYNFTTIIVNNTKYWHYSVFLQK